MRALGLKQGWEAFKARIKKDKKFEGAVYLVLLALLGLLYLSLRGGGTEGTKKADPINDGVESRLEQTLSCMRGVGDVRVMLTYREASEEQTEKSGREVQGVIVIAEGAENVATRLRIQNAVQTVLGIEAEQVDVFEMYERTEAN